MLGGQQKDALGTCSPKAPPKHFFTFINNVYFLLLSVDMCTQCAGGVHPVTDKNKSYFYTVFFKILTKNGAEVRVVEIPLNIIRRLGFKLLLF